MQIKAFRRIGRFKHAVLDNINESLYMQIKQIGDRMLVEVGKTPRCTNRVIEVKVEGKLDLTPKKINKEQLIYLVNSVDWGGWKK